MFAVLAAAALALTGFAVFRDLRVVPIRALAGETQEITAAALRDAEVYDTDQRVLLSAETTDGRRFRLRCDFDQIQIFVIRELLCISCRHCSEFFTVLVDDQNFSVPNFLVDLQFLFADKPAPPNMLFSNKKKRSLLGEHSFSIRQKASLFRRKRSLYTSIDRFDSTPNGENGNALLCLLLLFYHTPVPLSSVSPKIYRTSIFQNHCFSHSTHFSLTA